MKIRMVVMTACLIAGTTQMNAQQSARFTSPSHKHEFRIGMSDGSLLAVSDFLGMGLGDVALGTKRSEETSSGVYGLGYRYSLGRFRAGVDLAYANVTSKLALDKASSPAVKESEKNFLMLPTLEYTYFRKGIVELYGSVGAGVDLQRTSDKALNEDGKKIARSKTETTTNFAFQVNPVAVRIGSDWIGGFVEAGLGYKGFVTAGVSLRF